MRDVVSNRNRVGYSCPRKSKAFLIFEKWDFLNEALAKFVVATFQKVRGKEAFNIAHLHTAITHTALWRFNFNQRLKPS